MKDNNIKKWLISAYRIEYDDSACGALSDQDLNAALKALEGDVEVNN